MHIMDIIMDTTRSYSRVHIKYYELVEYIIQYYAKDFIRTCTKSV